MLRTKSVESSPPSVPKSSRKRMAHESDPAKISTMRGFRKALTRYAFCSRKAPPIIKHCRTLPPYPCTVLSHPTLTPYRLNSISGSLPDSSNRLALLKTHLGPRITLALWSELAIVVEVVAGTVSSSRADALILWGQLLNSLDDSYDNGSSDSKHMKAARWSCLFTNLAYSPFLSVKLPTHKIRQQL